MLGRTLAKFNYIYNNRVFERMSYKDLATPQLIKKMMQIPVKGLTKKAKYNFYQGVSHKTKIQTCFSEVKTNVLVKPNVFYKPLHSKVLGCRIKAHVSSTAYRTIRKYGGYLITNIDSTTILPAWIQKSSNLHMPNIFKHLCSEK